MPKRKPHLESAPKPPKIFFFHDTAPPEIYTLSLHDALPIYRQGAGGRLLPVPRQTSAGRGVHGSPRLRAGIRRRRAVRTEPNQGVPMKIRPLHDRVIVKRLDEEKKTASGIVIPDTAAEKPDQGEVTAVGKGKRNDEGQLMPLEVKIGDRVLFGKYSGQTVRVKGDELLVMREEDIMGIVEGKQ